MGPHEFFSHTTAAVLWGIPLPRLTREWLHVAVFPPHRLPRARGIRGHEMQRHLARVVAHPELGVRILGPASTWASLGAVLPDLFDLVAAGDAVVRVPRMPGGFSRGVSPPLADLR